MTYILRCALFIGIAATLAAGQSRDFSQLDAYLTGVAAQIPTGFEVAIVENGHQIYWKQFGPWTKDKQAKIASATKWLSGALIMSLVDDGILSLDDRASKYLPYMTGEKADITIRQLMSHTAGFPGEFPVVDPCLDDPTDTLDHCAQALAKVPLQAPPGTAFIYAGADMQIAGRVAEVAAGKDWQTLFRDRIATPLGLTATDYEYQGPTANPRISGGGRSNVTDYMKFLSMIRQRGMYNGRRVLSTRAIDAMLADQTAGAPIVESPFADVAPDNRYGIGNWLESPDPSGRTLQNSSIGVAGWTPLIDAGRNLQVVVGMQNLVKPFQPYYLQMKTIVQSIFPPASLTPIGITNAASFEPGPIAPGEVLALFGSHIGAATPSGPGVQITFDGTPGTVLFSSDGQLTAVAPPDLAGKASVAVQVTAGGGASPTVAIPVADAWPALFSADASGRGPAVLVNEDGSPNGPSHPARRGAVVQAFGTGACTSGQTAGVSATVGGAQTSILSCGPAAGLPDGVFRVALRVPPEAPSGDAVPLTIQAGGNRSLPAVTISVN